MFKNFEGPRVLWLGTQSLECALAGGEKRGRTSPISLTLWYGANTHSSAAGGKTMPSLAWGRRGEGEWGLFEFLYGNVWLLSETALNVKAHPPQRDSPGGRPMKDGLAAARHETNVTVKGQHGEHALCGRTFLAPHASSTFHAAHSPPRDLHQQALQTLARTLYNPTEKKEGDAGGLTLTVLRVLACRHSICAQLKES